MPFIALDEQQHASSEHSSTWVQVEASTAAVQQLHDTYRRSKFAQRFNVTLEDRVWALDCVHSRSVEIPQPLSELLACLAVCAPVGCCSELLA